MVSEGVVLLRIQHFEQGRRGIAAKVSPELVDFVEDEDGVLRLGTPQGPE